MSSDLQLLRTEEEFLRFARGARATPSKPELQAAVDELLVRHADEGEALLRALATDVFDWKLGEQSLLVPGQRLPLALLEIPEAARAALEAKKRALSEFHMRTLPSPAQHQLEGGMRCQVRYRPIERLGILLPHDGLAASLLLALAVPARVAGVEDIVVAIAPDKKGDVPKGVLAACESLSIHRVLRLGGAGAVLGLVRGVESLEPVSLCIGEDGESARLCMQRLRAERDCVSTQIAGDLAILTDGQDADAKLLAEELVLHAELGGPSLRAVLSTDEELLQEVQTQVATLLDRVPRGRKARARTALSQRGALLALRSLREASDCLARLRPSRVSVLVHSPHKLLSKLTNIAVVQVGKELLPSQLRTRQPFACFSMGPLEEVPMSARFLRPAVTVREAAASDASQLSDESAELWKLFEAIPELPDPVAEDAETDAEAAAELRELPDPDAARAPSKTRKKTAAPPASKARSAKATSKKAPRGKTQSGKTQSSKTHSAGGSA